MSIEAAHNPEEDNVLSTPNLTIEKIDEKTYLFQKS